DTPPLQQDEPIAEGTQILVTAPWGKDAVAVVSGCYSSPEGQCGERYLDTVYSDSWVYEKFGVTQQALSLQQAEYQVVTN
ncbi:MAG: hypothetical protein F6K14_24710, partial [Symploca sp. SIO2C1]|nr:hypothetical protein [Symploca sp. SIO2C1]